MTFSISAIMRALFAPHHRLSCNRELWHQIVLQLEMRGGHIHESGCFLLGKVSSKGQRHVSGAVFYDDLDPAAYLTGICILHADAFAKLWTICREKGCSVVADVHTHPGAGFQSDSDRTNPMVAQQGHIAIILPDYASWPVKQDRMGIYQYLGDHEWADQSRRHNSTFFYKSFWS